jgi:uncharacterized protein (TIGR03437 family)
MISRTFSALLGVSAVLLFLAPPAPGQQSYTFTKVLDLATQRPDGAGLFNINNTTTPAFDGQWVVFRDLGSKDDGSLQAIWSFNTKDGTFHKLADLHTVMPGGTATFTELHLLDTAPAVRNGTVIFLGRTFTTQFLEGLYSVPVGGGTVVKVADYATVDPSGGTFSRFDSGGKQMGGFAFDGTTVAFQGQGTTQSAGIYAANANGSSLSLIADNLHPYAATGASVIQFNAPGISGANVVIAGAESAGAATGYNGLYLGKAGNNGALTELVNSRQALPGDATTAFHTRFDAPYMGFDGTMVAFRADDAAAPAATPFFGLYWTDLTSHAINKIADVNSTLPGLGKLQNIADGGVAVSQGNVLFKAADTTAGYPGKNGLYVWAGGTPARAVGTGDVIDGKPAQVVHDPGPGALSGAGFVFLVEFAQTNGFAVYYAAPVGGGTVSSLSAASYSLNGALAPNVIASAWGQGLADTSASGIPPLTTTLANVTLNVKDSAGTTRPALLYYAGPTQINYVVPDGTSTGAATLAVVKNGTAVATGTIQVASVAPGVFTGNNNGAGAAAAEAVKYPAQSVAFTASCPSGVGSCVTAPFDLGAATDQVYLELFGTGIRAGKTATATIGGTSVPVSGFAAQSQFPGMDQVNILIPKSFAGRGEVDVILTVDGAAANTVKVNFK